MVSLKNIFTVQMDCRCDRHAVYSKANDVMNYFVHMVLALLFQILRGMIDDSSDKKSFGIYSTEIQLRSPEAPS